MAVSGDILRGHTEAIILRILLEGDSYGYEVAKKIISDGENMIDIKDATIYTAFKRMEEDGLISTYWGDGVGGARRKYYSVTQKGKDLYATKKEEWKTIVKLLNNLILGGNK